MSSVLEPPRPDTGLVQDVPHPGQASLAARRAPNIFKADRDLDFDMAAAAKFDFLLTPERFARIAVPGVARLLEIALDQPADSALAEAHPDWFVHGARGPVLRFLNEADATVDGWAAQLRRYAEAGVEGFYFRRAHETPPGIWRRLRAGCGDAAPLFIGEVLGATPAQLAAADGQVFDFVTSSSCFWDFSAPWLNAETERLQALAPVLALAAPPGAANGSEAAILRALRLAACYGAGWQLDAAFCVGHEAVLAQARALNLLRAEKPVLHAAAAARLVSSPGGDIAVLARGDFVMAFNRRLEAAAKLPAASLLPVLGVARLQPLEGGLEMTPQAELVLPPGGALFYEAASAPKILIKGLAPDGEAPRIAIEAITPQVEDGRLPARCILGSLVTVEADFIADGHDQLAGEVLLRAADAKVFTAYKMELAGNDRWRAQIPLERLGRHVFIVSAWKDAFATFADEVTKKHRAGVDITLELQEGLALVKAAAARDKKLSKLAKKLEKCGQPELLETLTSEKMAAAMRHAAPRNFEVRSHEVLLDAERLQAGFASWYEIFPRSQSGDARRHGNFDDVIQALPRIASMGFDVLYFPPIHPIGRKNRKGKNNTLNAGPDDPGSPYAIGSDEGGHDAIHPELGTFEDFSRLVAAAQDHGLEIALDFAIQCAPDHPWLKQHKGWFDWRPDGSLRYAENPPKKYEDIVNVDFYTKDAKPALWLALRDVVRFWVQQGIKIFRVDNPHTKPFPFWQWLIGDIRARNPEVIFLAEAFTRPKVMARLAKIGFSQSYTYFTWRNTKAELTEYLTELSTSPLQHYFRPNFFVNTPDINPFFLQNSGRGGFLIRAALAATLSGLWGVYNGFELCEATPVAGKEEYFNSEKYEIKAWDYDRPGNITAEITQLNRIRRDNAALHTHLNVEFLPCDNANILYFRKFAADGNTLLIAISLDPHNIQNATIELPLWRFGVSDDGLLAAEDLFRGVSFVWRGKYQPVSLSPYELPFCIWRVATLA